MIILSQKNRFSLLKELREERTLPGKILFSLVPNPAEEDNYDYPLPPCVGYVDLTGVRNGIAVFVCDGSGDVGTSSLCAVNLTVLVNSCNGRIR